jgi:hypothetical protein
MFPFFLLRQWCSPEKIYQTDRPFTSHFHWNRRVVFVWPLALPPIHRFDILRREIKENVLAREGVRR